MTDDVRVVVRPGRLVRDPADPGSSADLDAAVALARRGWDRWATSPSEWMDADWLESMSASPDAIPERECLVVELDGQLVAYVNIRPRPPFTEIEVSAHLDPDLGGDDLAEVVSAVIQAASAAGVSRGADAASGSALVFFTFAAEPVTQVLESRGFTFSREMLLMQRNLDADISALPLPEGVRADTVDVGRDLADLTEVSRAFEDHRGDYVADADSLRHDLTGPTSRPDLSWLARDDEGPVAAVVVSVDGAGGVVEMLMTVRRARGLGLGSALLTRAFIGLRGAGQTVAYLMVDATNPTGALGVYERAGMTVADHFAMWSRPLAPPSPLS